MRCGNYKVILGLVAAFCAAGCGASDGGVVAVKRPVEAAPEPGKMIAYSPVPIGFRGSGALYDRELLNDSRFNAFGETDGSTDPSVPAWTVSSADAANAITKSSVDGDRVALEFAAAANSMYIAQTTLPLDVSVRNAWIIASIDARCNAPNEFGETVSFNPEGGAVNAGVAHPGDNQWHKVECAVPLIAPVPGARITMSIVKRGAAQSTASVRGASLRVVQQAPSTVPGDSLIFNGSFDDYPFTGSFYPWRLRSWGGAKPLADLVTDGQNHLASFTPLTVDGAVALTQRVGALTDADKGKSLTASVKVTASAEGEFLLVLRPMKDGKQWDELLQRAVHPGDGKLHELTVTLPLPEDRLPDELFVDIYRQHTDASPLTADDVKVTLSATK